jgi:hypothetical protein
MSKYKIGDRVKFVGKDGSVSDTGIIYDSVGGNSAWAIWDSNGQPGWFFFDEADVSLVEPEQNKDDQIIDGIEYPYVTVDGNYPVRILCNNLKTENYLVLLAKLKDGFETIQYVTQDFKILVSYDEPYIKPYVKPKSIFEGLKSSTVVFARELTQEDDWFPVLFKEETSHFVQDIANRILPKTEYEFRLDNPYLED